MTGEVPGYAPYRGVDGQLYSPFGIAQSIWNVPFYVAGRFAAGRVAPGSATGQTIPKAVVALGTVPAVALLALVCFHLAVTLGAAPAAALRAVLLLVFGTSLWPYSGFGFNQPLTALFLWSAVFFAADIRRSGYWFFASGMFAGLAILTRHEMLLAAVVIGSYVVIRSWRRDSHLTFSYAAGLLPLLAAWCGLNWWRFGSPFESGYFRDQTPGFGSSIWVGAAGLLFSPYASLILYSPVVLLSVVGLRALWRGNRSAAVLFATLFLVYLVFYASLGNWMEDGRTVRAISCRSSRRWSCRSHSGVRRPGGGPSPAPSRLSACSCRSRASQLIIRRSEWNMRARARRSRRTCDGARCPCS